eukprot:11900412-Karenia_brevis.AAC.1
MQCMVAKCHALGEKQDTCHTPNSAQWEPWLATTGKIKKQGTALMHITLACGKGPALRGEGARVTLQTC